MDTAITVGDALAGYKTGIKTKYGTPTLNFSFSDLPLLPELAGIDCSDPAESLKRIGADDVRRYMDFRSVSPGKKRARTRAAKKFLGYCVQEGFILENPADEVEYPGMRRKRSIKISIDARNIDNLNDLFSAYRDGLSKYHSENTVTAYDCDLRNFFHFTAISDSQSKRGLESLTGISPEALKRIGVDDVHNYMVSGDAAVRTQKRRLVAVGYFLEVCVKAGFLDKNPVDEIEHPRIEAAKLGYVAPDRFDTILQNVHGAKFAYWRNRCILRMVWMGLKPGEITGMKYEDIKIKKSGKVVVVKRMGRSVEIPLSEDTLGDLGRYIDAYSERFGTPLSENLDLPIYRSRSGSPLDGRDVRREPLRKVREELGWKDVSLRSIHNGYLKMRIDEMLSADETLSDKEIARQLGTAPDTVRGLIEGEPLQEFRPA